ncbi:hypothetical protein D3C80_1714560 [compost metagenome]
MPDIAAIKLIKQPGTAQQRAVIRHVGEHIQQQGGENRPALLRDGVGIQLRIVVAIGSHDAVERLTLHPALDNHEHLHAGADNQHRHDQ